MNFLIRKGGGGVARSIPLASVPLLISLFSHIHFIYCMLPQKTKKRGGGGNSMILQFFYMLIFKNVCCEKGGGEGADATCMITEN